MKKAEKYRAHADECRKLATKADANAREQLWKMADTWESLAMTARRTRLAKSASKRLRPIPL